MTPSTHSIHPSGPFSPGHGATIHAATIEDNAFVGMGATVMDGAKVRRPGCFLFFGFRCHSLFPAGPLRRCVFLAGRPAEPAGRLGGSSREAARGCVEVLNCGSCAHTAVLLLRALGTLKACHPAPWQVCTGAAVAAGSLVSPGTVVPTGEIWAGSPAKFLRKLEESEAAFVRHAGLGVGKFMVWLVGRAREKADRQACCERGLRQCAGPNLLCMHAVQEGCRRLL